MAASQPGSAPSKKETLNKGERELYGKYFRSWRGVNTRSDRTAIPEDTWYNLENLQPVGDANIHVCPNIGSSLVNYGADTIYESFYANVAGTDYIFNFSTTGKLFAYNIGSNTSTLINPVNTLSGSGSSLDQWQNTVIVISDATGIFSWDGTTFTARSGVTSCPTSGNAIAVFAGRVWIAQARSLFFSAANSFTDYQNASGGGFVNLIDPQIRSIIRRLISANGYLYIIAGSAINVIADLYVPTGATQPVFTNVNIQSIIGSDQPGSVFPFDRYLMFANKYGAYVLSGTTAQKISDDIDGTWQYINLSLPISGGQVVVNNILTAAFLVQRLNDPVFGSNTVIGMWWDNKWWFANFGALTLIVSAVVNNVPTLYGFIGNVMYPLFNTFTTLPNTAFMSPLWAMEDPVRIKEAMRAGLEMTQSASLTSSAVTLSLDTENSTTPISAGSGAASVTWINNSSAAVQWQNNALALVVWVPVGYTLFAGMSSGGYGKYIGLRGTTMGLNFQLQGLLLDYEYAKRW